MSKGCDVIRIHIVSNSLKMNSGFSNVALHLSIGLRNLGHEVTFTGMQTPYIQDWAYGIENLPLTTYYIDELTRYILNLQKTKPDVVICIFQSDTGDLIQFPLAFKNTFWYCLLPDSPILTSDKGIQKIKDVKIGDKVLTHRGRFRRVGQVMKREYNGDMIKVLSHKLRIPIVLTPEHRILAIKTFPCTGDSGVDRCRPGVKCYHEMRGYTYKRCKYINGQEPWRKYKTEWIYAKDLQVGDLVVYPKSSEKEVDIDKIRIIDYIDDFLNVSGDGHNDFGQQTDLFRELVEKKISMNSYYARKCGQIPAEFELNKDIMRLFGYFIAEGGIYPNAIYFGFNIKEEKYINDVEQIMRTTFRLDPTRSTDSDGNGITLIYSNTVLANLFENLFAPKIYQSKRGRGKKSNIVRIPPEFLNLPLYKMTELIKGLWRGDGSNYETAYYDISTTSQTLAFQLAYILSKFDILVSIKSSPAKKENHSVSYDISIHGQDIDIFERIVQESISNRKNNINRHVANRYIKGKNYFYIPIKEIAIVRHNGLVYNLEVEEDNSYVSMIAVHNCVVEGDVLPLTSSNGYRQVIANGGKIVLPTKHGQRQAKESGIDVHRISYGFDDKIFKPLNLSTKSSGENKKINKKIRNDDIKYCFYRTEFGKLISNPIQLCKQGCYNCILEVKEQIKCQYFQEEFVVLLSYDKNEKKWIEKRIKISDLHLEMAGKFVFGHVKQNFGSRHRMERLLRSYSIFIGQSRQIRDRTILHLHCMPIAVNGVNLINIIDKLGIENNVIFSYGDFRASSWSDSAMNILYNTFDCDISASSGEGFGIPTLESMACGIPQIGPRSSSFPELVEESITVDNQEIGPRGILAKIAAWHLVIQDGSYRSLVDEEDLAKCMKLMYNGEDREIYIKNCLEFAKGYTWNSTIKQWDQLLKTGNQLIS